ncbi:hypothetical protein Dimus_038892 [Dionaea muscipula]
MVDFRVGMFCGFWVGRKTILHNFRFCRIRQVDDPEDVLEDVPEDVRSGFCPFSLFYFPLLHKAGDVPEDIPRPLLNGGRPRGRPQACVLVFHLTKPRALIPDLSSMTPRHSRRDVERGLRSRLGRDVVWVARCIVLRF